MSYIKKVHLISFSTVGTATFQVILKLFLSEIWPHRLYSWIHSGCVATTGEVDSSRHLFTHSGFPRVSWVWYFNIPGFIICLWTNGFRLTCGGRLFPSFNILVQRLVKLFCIIYKLCVSEILIRTVCTWLLVYMLYILVYVLLIICLFMFVCMHINGCPVYISIISEHTKDRPPSVILLTIGYNVQHHNILFVQYLG